MAKVYRDGDRIYTVVLSESDLDRLNDDIGLKVRVGGVQINVDLGDWAAAKH